MRPHASHVATAVLAPLFVAMLAHVLAPMLRGREGRLDAPRPALPPAAIQLSTLAERIVDAHLFGKPVPEGEPDPSRLVAAPASYLLRGTLVAGPGGTARAIIELDAGPQRLVSVDDSLPDGARVHRIEPLGVVLQRGGVLEWLALPWHAASAAREITASRLPVPQGPSTAQQAEVREARGEMLGALGFDASLDESGNAIGLRPSAGSRWGREGVSDGDVITAIDGVPVSRLLADRYALTRLAAQRSARFTVQRGGDAVTLDDVHMR